MKQDLLSITELAKLRKVTSETLQHDDRIGLIKPVSAVDPETKSRTTPSASTSAWAPSRSCASWACRWRM